MVETDGGEWPFAFPNKTKDWLLDNSDDTEHAWSLIPTEFDHGENGVES
jgi:hypothetical protein